MVPSWNISCTLVLGRSSARRCAAIAVATSSSRTTCALRWPAQCAASRTMSPMSLNAWKACRGRPARRTPSSTMPPRRSCGNAAATRARERIAHEAAIEFLGSPVCSPSRVEVRFHLEDGAEVFVVSVEALIAPRSPISTTLMSSWTGSGLMDAMGIRSSESKPRIGVALALERPLERLHTIGSSKHVDHVHHEVAAVGAQQRTAANRGVVGQCRRPGR